MIIIKIQGGLGNQISQYAFSRLLAETYPEQEIKLDINWFLYNPYNILEVELLKVFEPDNLRYSIATQKEIAVALKAIPQKAMRPMLPIRAFNKISRIIQNKLGCSRLVTQTLLSGYPIVEKIDNLDVNKSWYFDGFWVSYGYSEIIDKLRQELSFKLANIDKNQIFIDKIKKTESISIHVRMGDYKNSVFEVTTQNYYLNAIKLMMDKLKDKEDIVFFIFSDESDNAVNWLGLNDVTCEIVNVNSDESNYMDMYLMSQCKHNIITNSTFSYWAAQLSNNPDKIVIRPKMQNKERETWEVPGWIILEN